MARWRLTEPTYIHVEGTRWEYTEVDRITGRPKRTQFDVPRYIDPKDPADWTEKQGNDYGEVIVSDGHNPGPKDIVFKGEPNMAMLPIDDEAHAISAKFDWKPTRGLDNISQQESYTAQLVNGMLEKMSVAQANQGQVAGLPELMATMAALMKQNGEILNALVSPKAPVRRL